jgi:hypothetical protein
MKASKIKTGHEYGYNNYGSLPAHESFTHATVIAASVTSIEQLAKLGYAFRYDSDANEQLTRIDQPRLVRFDGDKPGEFMAMHLILTGVHTWYNRTTGKVETTDQPETVKLVPSAHLRGELAELLRLSRRAPRLAAQRERKEQKVSERVTKLIERRKLKVEDVVIDERRKTVKLTFEQLLQLAS